MWFLRGQDQAQAQDNDMADCATFSNSRGPPLFQELNGIGVGNKFTRISKKKPASSGVFTVTPT